MDTAQLLVTLGGAVLIAAVLVFFFGPGLRPAARGSRRATGSRRRR
jgi:hypothetical protein